MQHEASCCNVLSRPISAQVYSGKSLLFIALHFYVFLHMLGNSI